MIYLDNAATTYPKPVPVRNAVTTALKKYGANPGRSGHSMSMESAAEIYRCRSLISDMFNASGAENVVFTLNCTHAINMVLKGLLNPNDHVVVSCLEHNAVLRPLHALREKGITFTQAKVYPCDNDKTLDSFRNAINSNTALIACVHASNVWGIRLPVERICALGHQYGLPVLVDAAQTAGVLQIDLENSGIDYLCLAGHKGLYGPMGVGAMVTTRGNTLRTFVEGGTGTNSMSFDQPDLMPERFESGTPNMFGISGLRAGVEFVQKKKPEKIFAHEAMLVNYLYNRLSKIDGIKLYMPKPDPDYFVPVLSFNIEGMVSEDVGALLDKNGIKVRAGLHCASTAHKLANTLQTGAVRICPSAFSKMKEIDFLIFTLKKIIKKY